MILFQIAIIKMLINLIPDFFSLRLMDYYFIASRIILFISSISPTPLISLMMFCFAKNSFTGEVDST